MVTTTRRRPPPALPAADQATDYARAVIAGEYVVGKLVRLACERHLRDMEHGHERGLRWDAEAAEKAFRFFKLLRFPDGPAVGKPFILQPWQCFVIGSIIGWKRENGTRRFRYALVECARANGKTPMVAALGLYGLVADGEIRAQIYSGATTKDQAKILFNDADRMRESSPALNNSLVKTVNNLAHHKSGSYFRPLAAEGKTMDGLRVHMGLIDELHEHPNGDVMAKIRTGMKSSQPLLFSITTAGFDRLSVCREEHDISVKILEGVIENDTYFAYIAALDEGTTSQNPGDDWTDETKWVKANPNLGISVQIDTLREECELAKQVPGQQNSFKRLRLNMWTEQNSRWIDMGLYDQNNVHPVDPLDYVGLVCTTGLDLSTTTDLTARVHLFRCPFDPSAWDVVPKFWVPEEGMRRRQERDRVPYDVWVRDGYLNATSGDQVDYDVLREDTREDSERYQIHEIGYDPWNATQLATQLTEDGATVVPIRQGMASLSAPTKELERLIVGRKFHHGGHPVLRWNFSNAAVEQDAAGNIKLTKAKSTGRIDGASATVTALARAIVQGPDEDAWEFGAV